MTIRESLRPRPLRGALLTLVMAAAMLATAPAKADVARRGETKLVSNAPDGSAADGGYSSVSDDGRYVAFESWDRLATDDTDDISDVYVKDTVAGTTTLASPDVSGVSVGLCNHHPSISGDGRKVIYASGYIPNFSEYRVFGCGRDILVVRDLQVGSALRTVTPESGYGTENARISGDGRYVVVHADYENSDDYLLIYETESGNMVWRSPSLCWGCGRGDPSLSISRDGRFVTFTSRNDWVQGDSNGNWDVYLHDRDTDNDGVFDEAGAISTTLGSMLHDGTSRYSDYGAVSDDGHYVAFVTKWSRMCAIDGLCYSSGNMPGVWVRDVVAGTSEFISPITYGHLGDSTEQAAGRLSLEMSADGRYVMFTSSLPLAPGDTNAFMDVYVYDRTTKRMGLASVLTNQNQAMVDSFESTMTPDARFVSFGTKLLARDGGFDHLRSAYVRDMFAPCPLICPEDYAPDHRPVVQPVVDAANGAVQSQLQGKIFAPYDSSRACALWSTPRGSASTPVRTDATNYCWYNDSANSRGYDISSPPIYGVLEVGGWDYLWAPPMIDASGASLYRSELVEKSLPTSGTLTLTAHITGAVTATPAQFVDRFKGCLRLVSASTGSTIKLSCFNKTDGVKDLTVTANITEPVWAVVALEMTGDVGHAIAVVHHLSFSAA